MVGAWRGWPSGGFGDAAAADQVQGADSEKAGHDPGPERMRAQEGQLRCAKLGQARSLKCFHTPPARRNVSARRTA